MVRGLLGLCSYCGPIRDVWPIRKAFVVTAAPRSNSHGMCCHSAVYGQDYTTIAPQGSPWFSHKGQRRTSLWGESEPWKRDRSNHVTPVKIKLYKHSLCHFCKIYILITSRYCINMEQYRFEKLHRKSLEGKWVWQEVLDCSCAILV